MKCKCGNNVFECNAVETVYGRALVRSADDGVYIIEFQDDYGSMNFEGPYVCEECGEINNELID